jgi:hypothetical protein
MSVIPLQGQAHIVDTPESIESDAKYTATVLPGAALTSWVYNRVQRWENVRDRGYGRLWSEYWRMWRGKWAAEDQTRVSERSRLIAPALAQAIEASVSEIEEAVFSRENWFDIPDDMPEGQIQQAAKERDQLLVDLDKVNAKDAISEAVLNAAIFGTGIVQINTYVAADKRPERDPNTKELKPADKERVFVTVESIRPDEFIPDPAAKTVDEMLGAAVRRVKTQHSILEKIEKGIYRKDALPFILPQHRQVNYDVDRAIDPQSIITIADSDEVDIIEYHGKVPLAYIAALEVTESKSEVDELLAEAPLANGEGEELIEAIVTIANNRVLLRAIANPFVMSDRSIIAFQYEKVPGRFWGRGVSEKGYNAQKGLDATIRSYIDALGYVAAPMLGIDSGRMPRGFKQEVRPGRIWLTQGPPDEVLRPVVIGELNPALFQTASEMERMVQMGTGAFDTATALKNQSQSGANSASANSMLMGAFVKRAKRAIHNVDRNLLTPVVTKALWRYMQFDPVRYPQDFQFRVKTSLGIVAREVEAAQLTQLIGMLPDEFHQVKLVLAQGIVENTAISNKGQILQVIAQVLNPPPNPQQQHLQQLQMQAAEAELQEKLVKVQLTLAQIKETLARAAMEGHKAGVSTIELQQEAQKIQQQWDEIESQKEQNRISRQKLSIEDKSANAQLITAHANMIKANKPTPKPAS